MRKMKNISSTGLIVAIVCIVVTMVLGGCVSEPSPRETQSKEAASTNETEAGAVVSPSKADKTPDLTETSTEIGAVVSPSEADETQNLTETSTDKGQSPETTTPPVNTEPPGTAPHGYLLRNQRFIEGVSSEGLDTENIDSVFWYIFSQLPDEVTVYPSENYYYFILFVNGRQFWGNMRIPARQTDQNVLSFAYFEFDEFPSLDTSQRFSRAKMLTAEDGLSVENLDHFTHVATYRGKSVTFNFHQMSQEPPKLFPLGANETFVERTFDESGYQFFLIFNEEDDYLFWVLNEEEGVNDTFSPLGNEEDMIKGKRSGFVFWVDEANGNRKVLATIRAISVSRNDYYDGPFDQLADNYVDHARVSYYMKRQSPGLEGKIDKYGYYLDSERPLRVALSNYGTYYTDAQAIDFITQAKESGDPYQHIARKGVPKPTATPTPSPTPVPTPDPTAGQTDDES